MPLLIATGNPGKLAEFRRLLPDVETLGPVDAGVAHLAIEEVGATFRDNALLKAQAYAAATGFIAVADDSGLEVDALDGRPGVHSARYGGPGLDDAARCRRLLAELAELPDVRRTARFRCHLVAVPAAGNPVVEATGTCEGLILNEFRGEGGFGYDPVFYVPDLDLTLAQATRDEKNRRSHRGQAIRAIRGPLLRTFPELAG